MSRAPLLVALALLWAGPATAIVVQCPDKLWAGDDPSRCPCCEVCEDGSWHIEGEGECEWVASEAETKAKTSAKKSSDESGDFAFGAVVIIFAFVSYFLPSLIASRRKHPNGNSILVINLLLGWTVIGWVVALAMAVSAIPTAKSE